MKNALKCAFKAWMKEAKECEGPDEYVGWWFCASLLITALIGFCWLVLIKPLIALFVFASVIMPALLLIYMKYADDDDKQDV